MSVSQINIQITMRFLYIATCDCLFPTFYILLGCIISNIM